METRLMSDPDLDVSDRYVGQSHAGVGPRVIVGGATPPRLAGSPLADPGHGRGLICGWAVLRGR